MFRPGFVHQLFCVTARQYLILRSLAVSEWARQYVCQPLAQFCYDYYLPSTYLVVLLEFHQSMCASSSTPSTDRPIETAGTSFTIWTWENLETSTKRRDSVAAVAPREDVISSYLPPLPR